MKKLFTLLLLCLTVGSASAGSILIEGFEYANHDLVKPIGWVCDDDSWLCGYQEKDHNRIPHSGNWYAFSNADDSWMFMQLYLIPNLQYRINCWAISDGNCQLEFWAGTTPDANAMHTLLFNTSIGSESYEKISEYIETIPEGCYYLGIHAFTNGNSTHLTIDDIDVDQVQQYEFIAEPITGDSAMYPGTQGVFHFMIQNIGYDALDITAHPSNEFFTDFSCQSNGNTSMAFHAEPNEIVEVTMMATLRPEIAPGTVSWLDIQMTIPCNCNTALVTFWVTPLELEQTSENSTWGIQVYPNPVTDFVTIEMEGLMQINVIDVMGRTIKSVPADGNALQLDLTSLKAGVYFISARTRSTSSFEKSILKM